MHLGHRADWIEHVIATGGEPYLQTPENEMTLVELWNLDIFALLLFAVLLVSSALWAFTRACLWCIMASILYLLRLPKRKVE
jgi:hypothetical protein